jgi:hypothetical protein
MRTVLYGWLPHPPRRIAAKTKPADAPRRPTEQRARIVVILHPLSFFGAGRPTQEAPRTLQPMMVSLSVTASQRKQTKETPLACGVIMHGKEGSENTAARATNETARRTRNKQMICGHESPLV